MRALLKTANANMYRGGDHAELQEGAVSRMRDQVRQKVRETAYPVAGAMVGSMAGYGASNAAENATGYQEGPLVPVALGTAAGWQGGKLIERTTR